MQSVIVISRIRNWNEIRMPTNLRILGDKVVHNRRVFLIDSEWISFKQLQGEQQLINYCHELISNFTSSNADQLNEISNRIYDLLGEAEESYLDSLRKEHLTLQGLMLPPSKKFHILKKIKNFVRCKTSDNSEFKTLRRYILIEELIRRKNELDENLKKATCSINIISNHRKKIIITNDVDFEHFPSHLIYANENVRIDYDDVPALKCNCQDKSTCNTKVCSHYFPEKTISDKEPLTNTLCPYDENGKILLKSKEPVFECNKWCECDDTCPQRVVQQGSNVSLEIFRTWNNCGWGVRTLEFIPKGTFISLYTGKIIRYECGDLMKNQYYLFDLDFVYDPKAPHCPYTVDAYKYGNISRFFNHSCDPNMDVYCIYINNIHGEMPELAFFSNKNIEHGEELSFCYGKFITMKNCKCSICRT